MTSAALFVMLIGSLGCQSMAEDVPSVYVRISWDMEWRRFCHFVPFFAEKLSKELYETKVLVPYEVKASRIRFMNSKKQCENGGNDKDAILDFFVSKSEKDLGTEDVDRNITILAYTKLHDYWRNKKMALLDSVFIGQVNNVEIMGKDKPDIAEGMSESTRVGIGITVALIIVFLIVSITLCVNLRETIKNKKPVHGVPVSGIPLHVIRTEPSEPTIETEEPPAYNLDQQDGYDVRREESFNGYGVRNHGNIAYDDEYEKREDGYNGYAVRNHGKMAYDDENEKQEESYNGYGVRNHGNLAYDDDTFGSPML